MKQGQKSVRGGIEDFLCPMEHLRVTQADNMGTHKGTYATDSAGKNTGRDPIYMPFTGVLKVIDTSRSGGNAIVVESVNKVRFANGKIDYARMMVIHDNDRTGWVVGKTYPQGMQIAMEGDAGMANGIHAHIEVGMGKYTHLYDQNKYGVYHMPNNMPIEDACFADYTELLGFAKDWNWKYTKDVPVVEPKPQPSNGGCEVLNSIPSDFVYESATFTCAVDKLNIRLAPSLSGKKTGNYYTNKTGYNIVHYDGYVRRDGYIWISWVAKGARRWMAVGETNDKGINVKPYGKFS